MMSSKRMLIRGGQVYDHDGDVHKPAVAQDMLGLSPLTDEQTDVVISAYREAGIRVVFSPMVWDIPPIAMVRHKDSLPPHVQEMLGNKPRAIQEQFDYLEHQFKRHPAGDTLHWAVAPFALQRCTPKMLQGCAELAHKHDLSVYTHVYETRAQVLIARELFAKHGGSLISYGRHADIDIIDLLPVAPLTAVNGGRKTLAARSTDG